MDKIGIFKGKNISEMTREELLDFASWAGKKIAELETVNTATKDHRLHKEVGYNKKPYRTLSQCIWDEFIRFFRLK